MDLKYERKNVYKQADGKELKKIYDFAEGYKDFLNNSKTGFDRQKTRRRKRFQALFFFRKIEGGGQEIFHQPS